MVRKVAVYLDLGHIGQLLNIEQCDRFLQE